MTAYDIQALTDLDASASPAPPPRLSSPAAGAMRRVLHTAVVFALLLALALAPLAFRLYLIMR
jgi:hypothetical protein